MTYKPHVILRCRQDFCHVIISLLYDHILTLPVPCFGILFIILFQGLPFDTIVTWHTLLLVLPNVGFLHLYVWAQMMVMRDHPWIPCKDFLLDMHCVLTSSETFFLAYPTPLKFYYSTLFECYIDCHGQHF